MKRIHLLVIIILIFTIISCPVPTTEDSYLMANYTFAGTTWSKTTPDASILRTVTLSDDLGNVTSVTTDNILVTQNVTTLTFAPMEILATSSTFTYTETLQFTPTFNGVIFADDLDNADFSITTYDYDSAFVLDFSQLTAMEMFLEGLQIEAGVTYNTTDVPLFTKTISGTYEKYKDDLLNTIYILKVTNQANIRPDLNNEAVEDVYILGLGQGKQENWQLEPELPVNQTKLRPHTDYLVLKNLESHTIDYMNFSLNYHDLIDGSTSAETIIINDFIKN